MKLLKCNFFSKFDMYGTPVSLLINGDSNFKTRFGGITSITCMLFIVMYMRASFIQMLDRESFTTTSIQYRDPGVFPTPLNVSLGGDISIMYGFTQRRFEGDANRYFRVLPVKRLLDFTDNPERPLQVNTEFVVNPC